MKTCSTIKFFYVIPVYLFLFTILIQAESIRINTNSSLSDTITVSFREYGDNYKATLYDGELLELIKNGKKIDKKDFHEFEKLISSKMRKNSRFKFNFDDMNINFDSLNLKFLHVDSCKAFEFLKSDEFKENMKELKERIKSLRLEIELDSLDEKIIDLRNNADSCLRNKIKIYIDKNNTRKPRIHMKEYRNNSDSESEIVVISEISTFQKELKSELVKDGLIKEDDDLFKLKISPDEMIVNDKEVDSAVHKKYMQLYESKFGRELKGNYELIITD